MQSWLLFGNLRKSAVESQRPRLLLRCPEPWEDLPYAINDHFVSILFRHSSLQAPLWPESTVSLPCMMRSYNLLTCGTSHPPQDAFRNLTSTPSSDAQSDRPPDPSYPSHLCKSLACLRVCMTVYRKACLMMLRVTWLACIPFSSVSAGVHVHGVYPGFNLNP